MRRWIITWITLGCLTLGAGCVVSPTNGSWINPRGSLSLSGYASEGGEIIQVNAMDYRSGSWREIARFTASTTPYTLNGDTLYDWSGSVVFSSLPDWRDFWEGSGYRHALLHVRELGNGNVLTTFDAGGIDCVVGKLSQGTDWLTAGYECRSVDSPNLNLYWNDVQ